MSEATTKQLMTEANSCIVDGTKIDGETKSNITSIRDMLDFLKKAIANKAIVAGMDATAKNVLSRINAKVATMPLKEGTPVPVKAAKAAKAAKTSKSAKAVDSESDQVSVTITGSHRAVSNALGNSTLAGFGKMAIKSDADSASDPEVVAALMNTTNVAQLQGIIKVNNNAAFPAGISTRTNKKVLAEYCVTNKYV